MDLSDRLESYLFAEPRWVPVAEICERFGIEERVLRAEGRRRPVHADFAISSARPGAHGFKHISHASIKERLAHKHACLRRIIAGARAKKDYDRALRNAITGKWPDQVADAHGQRVLAL